MEIALIRHARPNRWEVSEQGDAADPELNELGKSQAQKLADFFASDEAPTFDGVYASTMARAVQTAAPLADSLGLPCSTDPDLVEYDHGLGFYIPTEELGEDYEAYREDLRRGVYAGHEIDVDGFQARVVAAIDRITQRHSTGDRIAIVCHGGVVSAYLAAVTGTPDPLSYEPTYTSISRVEVTAKGRRELLSYNETPHIGYAPEAHVATQIPRAAHR